MIRHDPALQRLSQALNPPYPDHLRIAATPIGRYRAHINDDPQSWEQTFGDPGLAIEATVWMVADRMRRNGAGWGAVIDIRTNKIIETVEIGLVQAEAMLDLPSRIVLRLKFVSQPSRR